MSKRMIGTDAKINALVDKLISKTTDGKLDWESYNYNPIAVYCWIGDHRIALIADRYPKPQQVFMEVTSRDDLSPIFCMEPGHEMTIYLYLAARHVAYRVDEEMDRILKYLEAIK
jgi:hypothetical protein